MNNQIRCTLEYSKHTTLDCGFVKET